jgi:hypothetical protein
LFVAAVGTAEAEVGRAELAAIGVEEGSNELVQSGTDLLFE